MNNNIWIEVNLNNLAHNLRSIRVLLKPQVKIMGVVKQNAYGHGIIAISKRLEKEKIDFLGVNNTEESLNLLESRIKTPILILSNTISSKNLLNLVTNKVRFTLMDKPLLKCLNNTARKANLKALVHIKIDTGMGRLGLDHKEALPFIKEALSFRNIEVEGLYSHFSSAEYDHAYTNYQIQNFRPLLENLKKNNISIKLAHICNSAGLVNFKSAHFNMVRSGIILYGLKPHPTLKINIRPVLSLKSKILHIKRLSKHSSISYGNTFKTKKDTLVGILACGYAYGYPRTLSNKTFVLVRKKKCRALGRICMDHMVVDLNPVDSYVNIGDEAVIIGEDGKNEITSQELAQKANTIPYEIVTCLSPGIKRIYI